jgi:hypothetical protein
VFFNGQQFHSEQKTKKIEWKQKGKTLHIPSFSKTRSPWTVCTFGVNPEQGKYVEIFLFVPMRSTK